ncbi:MAG: hypothetical protein ACLP7Q_07940 [Isosphaeraceae bacterium]
MGNSSKSMPMREPLGTLSWLYRVLLCLAIVPMAAALLGVVSVFTGTLMGELAIAAIMVVFLADIYLQVARARRMESIDDDWAPDLWDQDFDDD